MTELYSMKDVAKIFALQESRLRYWMQVGVVGPTVRKGGRFYFTFRDLVGVKAAKDLLAAGVTLPAVRQNLEALRRVLPDTAAEVTQLRICSDGETIVAIDDDVPFQPTSGQVVMAFTVPSLAGRVAEVMALPTSTATATAPVTVANHEISAAPTEIEPESTDATQAITGYRCFLDGCVAEDSGDSTTALHLYRLAIEHAPTLSAAHTNLGNLLHRDGDRVGAKCSYERALEHEPGQAEARYNLANVHEDDGNIELAIAELRQVCVLSPDFADAHYNLGLLLARVGGVDQARTHLSRYVELDTHSEWSANAHSYLQSLKAS